MDLGDFVESRFLIDALSMSSKIHSVQGLLELFGLQGLEFEAGNGSNAYRDSLYYDGVKVSYNGREDMGVCIELSGQGCRNFETHGTGDYKVIFDAILNDPDDLHLTRLDVAFDDQEGILDFQQLIEDTCAEEEDSKGRKRPSQFISKFRKHRVELGRPSDVEGSTIYWGSKHSSFFIRTYDKAKERGFLDGRHWIRMEMQMRDKYAHNFMAAAFRDGGIYLRETFLGVLQEYIRFVDVNEQDCNRWRWPTKGYWQRFLAGAEAVTLWDKPGVEYNESNLYNYVIKQAGNAIVTFIGIHKEHGFFQALQERKTVPNQKYQALLDKCIEERKRDEEEFSEVVSKRYVVRIFDNEMKPCNYVRDPAGEIVRFYSQRAAHDAAMSIGKSVEGYCYLPVLLESVIQN